MSRKTIITGALILTSANLITRCMGFFNRVYLSNTIGAEGMGLYQLILPVYGLAWSITSAGFTTAISRLTAQESALDQSGNIRRILKQSVVLSFCISLCVSFLLFFRAEEISLFLLKDHRVAIPLHLLAFAIPFMTLGSCFRGFFLGLQESIVPALSQILEQIFRILAVYLLAGFFVPLGLSYACMAATAGILCGELVSCLFTVWNYFRYKKKHFIHRNPSLSSFSALTLILSTALPLSASRISAAMLTTAENFLIPKQLQLYGQTSAQALTAYGELTGMAMPLLFLPSACLTAVSVSLVPEISEANAVKHKNRINRTITAVFLFTSIIGFGAASFFAVFPKEICYIVYNRTSLGDLLFPMAFLCPLLYAQTTLNGLLNGLGEQFFLFRNGLLSSLICIAAIWIFMPLYGITAFLLGWFVSLFFSVTAALLLLKKRTGVAPSLYNCFLKPMLSGAAAGLLIKYCIRISAPSKLLFLFSLTGMGLLYLLFLFLLGCLSKKEISFIFPNRKSRP